LKTITAGIFRQIFNTWGGTLLAALAWRKSERRKKEKSLAENILKAVREQTEHLGNTPTRLPRFVYSSDGFKVLQIRIDARQI